jgi:hypothetical protein
MAREIFVDFKSCRRAWETVFSGSAVQETISCRLTSHRHPGVHVERRECGAVAAGPVRPPLVDLNPEELAELLDTYPRWRA